MQQTSNAQMSPAPDLPSLLRAAHRQLLSLRRRQHALEAFKGELDRVARGKTFDIVNDIRWGMLLDTRDKNVIDLASWAKAAYSPGGFFGQLRAHHQSAFAMPRAPKTPPTGREAANAMAITAARTRLFGDAHATTPTASNLDGVREAFRLTVEPVVKDRHENRAHLYEKGGTGNAHMLDVDGMGELFATLRQTLNDLTLLAENATWADVDLNHANVEYDAEDVVDEVLLPRYLRHRIVRHEVARDAVYSALHELPHDVDGKPAFNRAATVRRVVASLTGCRDLADSPDDVD